MSSEGQEQASEGVLQARDCKEGAREQEMGKMVLGMKLNRNMCWRDRTGSVIGGGNGLFGRTGEEIGVEMHRKFSGRTRRSGNKNVTGNRQGSLDRQATATGKLDNDLNALRLDAGESRDAQSLD